MIRGSIPERDKKLLSPQNVHTGSGTHPASDSTDTGISFPVEKQPEHKVTTLFHLVQRLRRGSKPLVLHIWLHVLNKESYTFFKFCLYNTLMGRFVVGKMSIFSYVSTFRSFHQWYLNTHPYKFDSTLSVCWQLNKEPNKTIYKEEWDVCNLACIIQGETAINHSRNNIIATNLNSCETNIKSFKSCTLECEGVC
jgi:hypothetical protein